ncbi:MAG: hypothetical protein PSX36_01140 [bacterium]|nr:hypothetical protein [bacterium]
MRTTFTVLIICSLFTSCKDPLQLNNPINKYLDSEILDRISGISEGNKNSVNVSRINVHEVLQADEEIKTLVSSINLFDGSTDIMAKADNYFEKYASNHKGEKLDFIKISTLDSKPEMIVALKLNELALLDRVLMAK